MLANWITLSRFPILIAGILALYLGTPVVRLAGVGLILAGLALDTVDGMVARKTRQISLIGSVLDIAADRTYELVLWVCFADLRMIPVAIPVIVLARTALTDALRSVGVGQGIAPFQQHRTALGRFLVASTPMRVGYQLSKTTAFAGLGLVRALDATALLPALRATAWVAVGICVLRGLPVLGHAVRNWMRRDEAGLPTGTLSAP